MFFHMHKPARGSNDIGARVLLKLKQDRAACCLWFVWKGHRFCLCFFCFRPGWGRCCCCWGFCCFCRFCCFCWLWFASAPPRPPPSLAPPPPLAPAPAPDPAFARPRLFMKLATSVSMYPLQFAGCFFSFFLSFLAVGCCLPQLLRPANTSPPVSSSLSSSSPTSQPSSESPSSPSHSFISFENGAH